jgi:hypothetical protein
MGLRFDQDCVSIVLESDTCIGVIVVTHGNA